MALAPGTVLAGRFQVIRAIGEGGMGAVYEAMQLDLGRRVAIKIVLPRSAHDPLLIARLRREAEAAAPLQHPNILSTTGFYAEPGELAFLVMEYIEGESLRALLEREGTLPIRRAVHVAMQVLDALEVAHRAGVVHRDLKPSNLLVAQTPAVRDLVRLLDFGIAKVLDEERFMRLTRTGAILGTPGYMAPEQCTGQGVDGRTDLYSLGVVLYRSIAGRLPFLASDETSLLVAVVQSPPIPLESARPDVPHGLSVALERVLSKSKEQRFGSAAEMREALLPYALAGTDSAPRYSVEGPIAMTRSTAPPSRSSSMGGAPALTSVAAPPRRIPRWFYVACAVVGVLGPLAGAFAAVLAVDSAQPEPQQPAPTIEAVPAAPPPTPAPAPVAPTPTAPARPLPLPPGPAGGGTEVEAPEPAAEAAHTEPESPARPRPPRLPTPPEPSAPRENPAPDVTVRLTGMSELLELREDQVRGPLGQITTRIPRCLAATLNNPPPRISLDVWINPSGSLADIRGEERAFAVCVYQASFGVMFPATDGGNGHVRATYTISR